MSSVEVESDHSDGIADDNESTSSLALLNGVNGYSNMGRTSATQKQSTESSRIMHALKIKVGQLEQEKSDLQEKAKRLEDWNFNLMQTNQTLNEKIIELHTEIKSLIVGKKNAEWAKEKLEMEIKHAEKQQKFETVAVPWSVLTEIGISRSHQDPVGHLRKHFNETAKSTEAKEMEIKEYERRIEEVNTRILSLEQSKSNQHTMTLAGEKSTNGNLVNATVAELQRKLEAEQIARKAAEDEIRMRSAERIPIQVQKINRDMPILTPETPTTVFNKVAEKRRSDAGALANAKRIRHPSRKVAATETNVQKAPLTSTQSVALHYVSPTFSHAPTSSTNSVQCTSSLENVVVKKEFNGAPKKILFWQINGLVAAIRDDCLIQLELLNADIVILFKTKCKEFPVEFKGLDYKFMFLDAGKGVCGLALLSREEPLSFANETGDADFDRQARFLQIEFSAFYLVGICMVTVSPGDYTQSQKRRHEIEDLVLEKLKLLDKKKPVIYCGVLNVAHDIIDLKRPRVSVPCFTEEERADFSRLLNAGFVDVWRRRNPESEEYTHWSNNMSEVNATDNGMRLDYFLVSERIFDKVTDCKIHSEIREYEHCPLSLTFSPE